MKKANVGVKVEAACKEFITKKFTNKDGRDIRCVSRKEDSAFIELFKDKTFAKQLFMDRLSKIDAIRFNDLDKGVIPLKFVYDDMLERCGGKLEGGLFAPMYGDAVVILNMDFKNKSKAEGTHTQIHETVHGMTITKQKDKNGAWYQIGICEKHQPVLKILNEGITELIAQMIWEKMYAGVKCPGFGRYAPNVEAAKKIIAQFGDEQKFIEEYIIDGNIIIDQMKRMFDAKNQTLYDFLLSLNNVDLRDEKVRNYCLDYIKNFSIVYELNV